MGVWIIVPAACTCTYEHSGAHGVAPAGVTRVERKWTCIKQLALASTGGCERRRRER
jgi:hypothetical protein